MKYKVYYSVQDNGDGSAYPMFYEDEDCAATHQMLQSELYQGWGEDCTGSLDVESDSPVKFDATSRSEYIKELEDDLENYDLARDQNIIKEAIAKLKGK